VKTATRIVGLDRVSASGAHVRCYRLTEPLDGHETVAVSAVVAPFSGPETYIFPCDETGWITAWGELDGSYRGGLDHAAALEAAGYTVVDVVMA
jgi:hypothetical protein